MVEDAPFRSAYLTGSHARVWHEGDVIFLRNELTLPEEPRTLCGWLDHWSQERPDALFIAERAVDGWQGLTFAQTRTRALRIARTLDKTIARRTAIAAAASNSVNLLSLILACHYGDRPIAVLNPRWLSSEIGRSNLEYGLSIVDAEHVFVDGDAATSLQTGATATFADLGALCRSADTDRRAFRDRPHPSPAGVAKYLFTSGSSGRPKCVPQTHAMLAAAAGSAARVSIDPRPYRAIDWLPWHHVMGGNISVGRALARGGTLYIDDGGPSREGSRRTLENAAAVGPTSLSSVPIALEHLVDEFEIRPQLAAQLLESLSLVGFGGAALSRPVATRLQRLAVAINGMRMPILSGYGATEASGPALGVFWEADDPEVLGIPYPGVTAKLTPIGEGVFDLALQGPTIFSGYLGVPSKCFDEDGFFCTGDRVRFQVDDDHGGLLRFAGRASEEFKLATGSWVRAADLRRDLANHFQTTGAHWAIFGEGQREAVALAWLSVPDAVQLGRDDAIVRLAAFNQGKPSSMRIAALGVIVGAPSLAQGELTEKGSINPVAAKTVRAELLGRLLVARPGTIEFEDENNKAPAAFRAPSSEPSRGEVQCPN
jgi:feruloyl-CoA synthase